MSKNRQRMAWIASAVLQLLLSTLGALAQNSPEEIRVPPSIVTPRERHQIVRSQNEKVLLSCNASGTPAPSYKWLWDNNEIDSQFIDFDVRTGVLTIPSLSEREEGSFVCQAKSTFNNGLNATAVSAIQEIRVALVMDAAITETVLAITLTATGDAGGRYPGRVPPATRVGDFMKRPVEDYSGKEGDYIMIPCDRDLPLSYGPITFKWYKVEGNSQDEIRNEHDPRITIDQTGNIHFSYLIKQDEVVGTVTYKCALSSALLDVIKLGNANTLSVTAVSPIPQTAPKLQFTTSGTFLTAEVGKNVTLECVFSGYVPSSVPSETVPTISWYDQDGGAIVKGGRYDIIKKGLVLVIVNVTEDDEKVYKCKGTNSLGSDEGTLSLNVTSRPIWVHPLESVTAVQGKDAVFTCITRSAKGEQKPNQPIWSRNGNTMDSSIDPNKYQFIENRTILTVKHVNKDTDIACYQCNVANSVGMTQDDGCLNVVVPIEVTVRPKAEQTVSKGDEVDLTTVATTDPLFRNEMTYSWIFKDKTYNSPSAPPHGTYDIVNNLAYINTSALTMEEFKNIGGVYRRVISHPVETIYVDVTVNVFYEPFDYWIIGLIIGIIIIIVILLIICVIYRRKILEGTYPVDKKEAAAGLDPEKELKDSGFHDLSRADFDNEYPEKKPQRDLDFDPVPIGEADVESFSEYGEEPSNFNEDGSFIGVYSKVNKKAPKPPNPTESNV